jgi:hypothetical protein
MRKKELFCQNLELFKIVGEQEFSITLVQS